MDYENILTSLELPRYSPSMPSPNYSHQLSSGERLLEHTPHQPPVLRPSGLYIRKDGATTVILSEQEEGVTMPSYGRQATINGNLCFEQNDNIVEVTAKINGTMDIFSAQGGSRSITVVDLSYPLWSQVSAESQSSICPAQISFSGTLPATFKADDDRTLPIPPTYNSPYLYLAGPFAKVSYVLQIAVKRTRHPKLAIWPKIQQIYIPFNYVPRTRAHHPIMPDTSFLSSIKNAPEEWYQAIAPLNSKRGNMLKGPLHCLLFIPGHRVYGLSDTIPFHIQLTGDAHALQEIFSSPEIPGYVQSSSEFVNNTSSHISLVENIQLEVVLLRQVAVSFKGSKSWEDSIIGKAEIRPMQRHLTDTCASKNECMRGHVDWEGELRCKELITVGGFDATNIHVKDFLVLKIIPSTPKSPFQVLQITVPIRLVTDSCDVAGLRLISPVM